MQPIVQQKPESNFFYFFDSLCETFNPSESETLWTFSIQHGIDALYRYVEQSRYLCSKEALKAAKLHILINFCERSTQNRYLADHASDRILAQSESNIALFGVAENMLVETFHLTPQGRIDALRNLQLDGKRTEYKNHLIDLDGRKLCGVSSIELIELDSDFRFLLELFKLSDG